MVPRPRSLEAGRGDSFGARGLQRAWHTAASPLLKNVTNSPTQEVNPSHPKRFEISCYGPRCTRCTVHHHTTTKQPFHEWFHHSPAIILTYTRSNPDGYSYFLLPRLSARQLSILTTISFSGRPCHHSSSGQPCHKRCVGEHCSSSS